MNTHNSRRNFTGILTVSTGLVLTLFLAACTPTENANLTAGNGETATLPEAGDTNDSATVKEDGGGGGTTQIQLRFARGLALDGRG